jgi:hypothetical protein
MKITVDFIVVGAVIVFAIGIGIGGAINNRIHSSEHWSAWSGIVSEKEYDETLDYQFRTNMDTGIIEKRCISP